LPVAAWILFARRRANAGGLEEWKGRGVEEYKSKEMRSKRVEKLHFITPSSSLYPIIPPHD